VYYQSGSEISNGFHWNFSLDIFDVSNLRDHHGFVPFGGVGRTEPADLHLPHNPPPVRNSGQLIRRSLQGATRLPPPLALLHRPHLLHGDGVRLSVRLDR
jgi:hypothetical protein